MSYILDSLKKSDQERKRGSVPGVLSDHGGSGPEPGQPRRRRWPYLLGGGFLLLSGIVLAIWVKPWQPAGTVTDVPVAAAPDEATKVAVAKPKPRARTDQKPPAIRPLVLTAPAIGVQRPAPPTGAEDESQEIPPGLIASAQPHPGMSWGAPVAGGQMGGRPVAGATAPGDPVARRPVAGGPMGGRPVAGEPVPVGMRPIAGGRVAGGDVAGDKVVGGKLAGGPVAGDPEATATGAEVDRAPAVPGEGEPAPPAEPPQSGEPEEPLPAPDETAPPEAAPEAGTTGTPEPPEPLPEPEPSPGPAAGQPEAPTELDKLPPSVRSGLPKIQISAHFYSKKPASRLASVNGRIMREGQELDGLKVEEITPSGVVFLYNGRKFFVDVF